MPHLELTASLRGHAGAVWSLSWSPRGLLSSCGADRTIRVWHRPPSAPDGAAVWACLAVFGESTFLRAVRDISWAPDGRSLAVASFDATAFVLELLGGNAPRLEAAVSLEGHDSEVKGVAYSSSGALLATCSRDKSVWIWEVGLDFDYECIAVLNGHAADVKSVAWHPAVEMLVSSSFDGTVRVWVEDEDDWFCAETLAAHTGTVWDMAFDARGRGLATVGADGGLVVWRREDPPAAAIGTSPAFRVVGRYTNLHAAPIYSVDWNTTNALLVTAGGDDTIRIIRCIDIASSTVHMNESDTTTETETGQKGEVPVANGPDAKQPQVTSNLKEHCQVLATEVRAHSGDVNRVAWSPVDDTVLASCGDDGLVRIWKYCEEDESRTYGT